MHSYKSLKIVDWREPLWPEQLVEAADSRRNFVAILNEAQDLDTLCARLGCGPPRIPERFLRWGIHARAEVLESQDYSTLLGVYEQFPVHLVEQLHLTRNHPPVCQPFLLYCEIRGIISDHSSLEEAGTSLL